MKHFLLVFDRSDRRLLQLTPYVDADEALTERFAAERMHRASADIEVVVLTAESEAALRRTHSRYFEELSSLALPAAKKATAHRASKAKLGR